MQLKIIKYEHIINIRKKKKKKKSLSGKFCFHKRCEFLMYRLNLFLNMRKYDYKWKKNIILNYDKCSAPDPK